MEPNGNASRNCWMTQPLVGCLVTLPYGMQLQVTSLTAQSRRCCSSLSSCTVVRTGINLNVVLTLERDRRSAGMWQAKSKPQAIVINERLKKVRFH
jgi:hypothetical protein